MRKAKNNNQFIRRYRYAIALILVLIDAFILPHIPYINLLYVYLNILIVLPAFILLVGLKGQNLLKTGIVLFVIMLIMTLLGRDNTAESIGNITYFILLLGVILLMRDMIKKE